MGYRNAPPHAWDMRGKDRLLASEDEYGHQD